MKENLSEYQAPKIQGENLEKKVSTNHIDEALVEYNFIVDEDNLSDNFVKDKKKTLND
jgi:hypothetical protein